MSSRRPYSSPRVSARGWAAAFLASLEPDIETRDG
jgi:hypothetical protein